MTPAPAGLPLGTAGRRDIAIGLALTAIGLGLYYIFIPLWVAEPPAVRGPLTHPKFIPNVIAWATVLLGLAIAAFGWLERRPAPVATGESPLRGLVIVLAAITGYLGLAEYVGALLVAIAITVGLQVLGGERRWWMLMVGGVAVPVSAILILRRFANVPLPEGILTF